MDFRGHKQQQQQQQQQQQKQRQAIDINNKIPEKNKAYLTKQQF